MESEALMNWELAFYNIAFVIILLTLLEIGMRI